MTIRKQTTKMIIGSTPITLISEIENKEIFDTEVKIGEQLLCVIAGDNIRQFIEEFQKLINKYRI